MAVNNPTLLNRIEIIPGIADHDIVLAELNIAPQRHEQTMRKIPIFQKGRLEQDRRGDDKKTQIY